jgi:tripartite-type tricarboxylate transporter receptor subunit TctC
MPRIQTLIRAAVFTALSSVAALCSLSTQAQSYPTKPVRVLIGQPPGGVQDTLLRGMTQELTRVWGQPVTLEHRVGGTGVVAAVAAARAAPDGYTIFFSTSTNMNTAQYLQKNLPYSPEKDFMPVVGMGQTKSIMVAGNHVQANTVKELVALAKAKPGALNYGSFGVGSAAHLDVEAFSKAAGFTATHVPYKSGAEVMTALMAGQVEFGMTGLTAAIPLVNAGRLKGLSYTGDQRASAIPQVPTLAEAGYGGFETGGMFALYVPTGTPQAVMDKIANDATAIRSTQAFREKILIANGMEDLPLQGAALIARFQKSREDFALRVKGLNIVMN